MDPELDDAPELTEYYFIFKTQHVWRLRCRVCHADFMIPVHPSFSSYRKALLGHAGSHSVAAWEKVDEKSR